MAGKPIRDFILDLNKAVVIDATGKLGNLGKRVDIAGHSASGLEETLSLEVYDNFPGMALVTASYRNPGTKDLALDRVSTQEHRINASLADAELWHTSYGRSRAPVLPGDKMKSCEFLQSFLVRILWAEWCPRKVREAESR